MNMRFQIYPRHSNKLYQKMKQAYRVCGQWWRVLNQSTDGVRLHIPSTTILEQEYSRTQGLPHTSESRRRRVASLRSSDVIVQLKVAQVKTDQILQGCSMRSRQ